MSSLPTHAMYKHLKTFCEHTLDNSPTVSSSSLLKLWSSKHGVGTLYNCSVFLVATLTYLSTHFFASSRSQDQATVFCVKLFSPK